MAARTEAKACGPLAGLRVIDLTSNVFGPTATQMLGEMGADVIKVEAPGGDETRKLGPTSSPGMTPHFHGFNRYKRSIVLDLKGEAGRKALSRLIETADIFVHTMRPSAAERLNVGYEAVAAVNPGILYVCGTGYQHDGPNGNRPAYDDVVQAESGMAGIIAAATGVPNYVPMALADKVCGIYLFGHILLGLLHRERFGEGQQICMSMYETMVGFNLSDHMWNATYGDAEGAGYPRMFVPYRRPLPTSDGYLAVMAMTDRQWTNFFTAMERQDLKDDPRFVSLSTRTLHIEELYSIVAEELAKRTTAEWRERLTAADVPNGDVKSLDDIMRDGYLKNIGFFRHVDHPREGPLTMMKSLEGQFSAYPDRRDGFAPRLGEHTEELLREIGCSEAEADAITGSSRPKSPAAPAAGRLAEGETEAGQGNG